MAYQTIEFNAAGVTFEGRQNILHNLKTTLRKNPNQTAFARFVRERNNKHDTNAIKILVYTQDSNGKIRWYPIGYVPKATAAKLAPMMDNGARIYNDRFDIIGGAYDSNLGCKIYATIRN